MANEFTGMSFWSNYGMHSAILTAIGGLWLWLRKHVKEIKVHLKMNGWTIDKGKK
jgi:hypothetical protein